MSIRFSPQDIAALARPVPRYTSYPTAPHFTAGIGVARYREWLGAVPAGSRISLYLHIPFCDTLCWFCGCHTRMVRRYDPVRRYLDALEAEIVEVAACLAPGVEVSHIHWGGGSPTMLTSEDIARLAMRLGKVFRLSRGCEFAVEIDPRGMDAARLDALAASGLTRASIGVQDFDPAVQAAINRVQSLEETRRVVDGLRARDITSLNIDMLYGLPHQTPDVMLASLEEVLALEPDRLALFGYAHVPWVKKHQEMIPAEALPGMPARIESAERAAERLLAAGYARIGIDHFARPDDPLALAANAGTLRRNFQGYTADRSNVLIGLGASSIGQFAQGFVQNETSGQAYERRVKAGDLAISRGLELSEEDRVRAFVIEDLMCNLRFDCQRIAQRHGQCRAQMLAGEAKALLAGIDPGWAARTPDGFIVTEAGRPFLRLIAARFDAYLANGAGRHSSAM